MPRDECISRLQDLVEHAWEQEVRWPHIDAWAKNFSGLTNTSDEEQTLSLFALSRFMYFGKGLVRELLKSLYRDHFEAPLMQRIRRNYGGTTNIALLRSVYASELKSTRFIGVGNPAESGAHLLYYFRQVNRLSKDLFADVNAVFTPYADKRSGTVRYQQRNPAITRLVFFDDLVGSGSQANQYLAGYLKDARSGKHQVEIRFLSLFATTEGLAKINVPSLFDGKAQTLFELDESYKAFHAKSRYFDGAPAWFDVARFQRIAEGYGMKLQPGRHLGYRNGQLLLGFTHNTPDNTLPIFWDEGGRIPWSPVFTRFDKNYGA
jgi:hypothetical protein